MLQILTFLYMRDSLFLTQYGLLVKNERLIEYQADGITIARAKIARAEEKYSEPEESVYQAPWDSDLHQRPSTVHAGQVRHTRQ